MLTFLLKKTPDTPLKRLTARGDSDSLGCLFGLTEHKPKLKTLLRGNETWLGKKENKNTTHQEICARAKHAHVRSAPQDNASSFQRTTSHWGLANLSGGSVSEEGGDERTGGEHKAERAFRRASPDNWSCIVLLLPCEWTEKEKVMACANTQRLLRLTPFDWASSVDAFNSQAFKQLRNKCWNP